PREARGDQRHAGGGEGRAEQDRDRLGRSGRQAQGQQNRGRDAGQGRGQQPGPGAQRTEVQRGGELKAAVHHQGGGQHQGRGQCACGGAQGQIDSEADGGQGGGR